MYACSFGEACFCLLTDNLWFSLCENSKKIIT